MERMKRILDDFFVGKDLSLSETGASGWSGGFSRLLNTARILRPQGLKPSLQPCCNAPGGEEELRANHSTSGV
jgi:hypothetical protein